MHRKLHSHTFRQPGLELYIGVHAKVEKWGAFSHCQFDMCHLGPFKTSYLECNARVKLTIFYTKCDGFDVFPTIGCVLD